jgi:hypothetical protein
VPRLPIAADGPLRRVRSYHMAGGRRAHNLLVESYLVGSFPLGQPHELDGILLPISVESLHTLKLVGHARGRVNLRLQGRGGTAPHLANVMIPHFSWLPFHKFYIFFHFKLEDWSLEFGE